MSNELPVPSYFDSEKVAEVWRVPYQECADQAEKWRKKYKIAPSTSDKFRICLMPVDVQNTFCIPGFELFVAGSSGRAAVDDNIRLCEFIYRNLPLITEICPTMDTHQAMQIFHSIFLINKRGQHPPPSTLISAEDIRKGKWRFNAELCSSLGIDKKYGQRFLEHYVQTLQESSKYDLTIWPYHAMLGGIGHALVSSVEEAIFFHSISRFSQPDYQIKGNNPLTENYSVLSPEVLKDHLGEEIAFRNTSFIQKLLRFDAVVIAGQAKSHCVAFTISDFLKSIRMSDSELTRKVYVLEDCMSSIVIPGVVDYTDITNETFANFAKAGMNIVKSTTPISEWPGIDF